MLLLVSVNKEDTCRTNTIWDTEPKQNIENKLLLARNMKSTSTIYSIACHPQEKQNSIIKDVFPFLQYHILLLLALGRIQY